MRNYVHPNFNQCICNSDDWLEATKLSEVRVGFGSLRSGETSNGTDIKGKWKWRIIYCFIY